MNNIVNTILIILNIIYPLLEVIILILPALLGVAYITVAERKTMASMQRRLGPNIVGQFKFNTC